jgi:predicted lipoprotein with Yx(FWY)xxD motif
MLNRLKQSCAALAAAVAITAGLGAVTGAAAPLTLGSRNVTGLGTILTDPAGRTLYTYTSDEPGVSHCYDTCASFWPPLQSEAAPALGAGFDGVVGATVRADGTNQVTYNGWPLYYFASDAKAGDVNGQAKNGVWYVVHSTPAPTVQVRQDPQLGPLLTDGEGKTLYLFANDQPGVSNCSGECAAYWPPLTVQGATGPTGPAAVAGGLGTITRDDGTQQVTYNGAPLYGWVKDVNPTDTTGQGVNGVWFVVPPAAPTASA